jgi:hypothetical protein
MTIRREHYSTALTQAQGIVEESLHLFELWEPGMSAARLFETAKATNLLGSDSERRLRNIVIEGFASRFLREPHLQAAPALKRLLGASRNPAFVREVVFLYAVRQHGIFFDFLTKLYWPAVQASGVGIDSTEIGILIDRGRVEGRLEKDWSPSVRRRVSSYVLGIAKDFNLMGQPSRGSWRIQAWHPQEQTLLYLAYDLHFLGLSDDQVVQSDQWRAFGLERPDVIMYFQRFQTYGHLLVQDSGVLTRIDWKYPTRDAFIDVLLRL